MIQTAQKQKIIDWKEWSPKRGEIYLVDLGNGENIDSEQRGIRPAIILSNDVGNRMSSIVTIAPISTRNKKFKVHVPIGRESGLKEDSFILTEHIRTVSKRRFFNDNPICVGKIHQEKISELENTIKFELGFVAVLQKHTY